MWVVKNHPNRTHKTRKTMKKVKQETEGHKVLIES